MMIRFFENTNRMTQDEEYRKSVEQSQSDAHEETMWGKPARDIITGISNNTGVNPVRAIWELVQNARDVVKPGCRAKIQFVRNQDSLIFQHDGIPFTHKTIEALILQTSSKAIDNHAEVGQYGTGFLTTHKFGMKFELTAPMLTSEKYRRYYKIQDFVIDRSTTDKVAMRKSIEAQWKETRKWGVNFQDTTDTPFEFTIFKYLYDTDKAKQNAEEAFRDAPAMTPYVLLLNPHVEQIVYVDNVLHREVVYLMPTDKAEKIGEIPDGIIYRNTIVKSGPQISNGPKTLYYIESKELTDKKPFTPKATVILPVVDDEDGNLRVFQFAKTIPQIYIYLPLLGTEQWGFNFLFHSSLFTCDRDSRDSLRLVGNGQNNDYQAECNRQIISLVNKLILQFVENKLYGLKDAKYIVPVNFKIQQSNDELSDYYKGLQVFWRDNFETLRVVNTEGGGLYEVKNVKVFDDGLYKDCDDNKVLLDAIYNLLNKEKLWRVPDKSNMVYWSRTINDWYPEGDNFHQIGVDDLAESVSEMAIEYDDLGWLHTFCQYIIDIKRDDLFSKYKLIPNDQLTLQHRGQLEKPVTMANVVRQTLNVMAPEKVACLVHPMFIDVVNDNIFGYSEIKDCITKYINNHNNEQNNVRSAIQLQKKSEIDNPDRTQFDATLYENRLYGLDVVQCMVNVLKSLLAEESISFGGKVLGLFEEFYGITACADEGRLGKEYDLEDRAFYNALIYDSLFRFTLMSDKTSKADWIRRMVETVYSYSDTRSFLASYQVYPDQKGVFKYSDWLQKQTEDTPDRALEIFDEVILFETNKSIKDELVDKAYGNFFQGNKILNANECCKKIEEEVAKRQFNLNGFAFKNQIVEIINHLTTEGSEQLQWKRLFTDIDNNKGQLMLSTLQDQARKDSLFSLIQIEDASKLRQISDLANDPRMEQIVAIGRIELQKLERENSDMAFKKDLGEYVERLIKEELNIQLSDETLRIKPVENEQNGQDLVVYVNGEKVYYIEVKSRWTSDRSVLMSTQQHRTSCEQKERYALCAVDMVGVDKEDVKAHRYPAFEEIENRITVLENIGVLNERLSDATDNDNNRVHVNGGYQVLVSQDVIDQNGIAFRLFLNNLKVLVKKYRNL